MKTSIKIMLAAGLLSAGFVGTVSANTAVYLTGSSAFRASDTNAIIHLFGGTAQAAYDGTKGLGSATHQVITGTYNGKTYDVYTCWTGSLSGLIAINFPTAAQNAYFTSNAGETTATAGSGASSSNGATGGASVSTSTANHAADGAFSDVYATSTPYNTGITPARGTDGIIGVVPFVFVGNPDLKNFVPTVGGQVTNIDGVQAQQLYGGGLVMPQLTGNDADYDKSGPYLIVATGRDADSGTRFTTFAETGFNPVGAAQQQPTQYTVSTSGSSISVDPYPAETLFPGTGHQISYAAGNGGYPSGGNEQSALNILGTTSANSDNQTYVIGSLGESDAKNAVSNSTNAINAYFLSYNGQSYGTVTYTTSGSGVAATVSYNRTAVDEGIYTFWGYEHCYYVNSDANAALITAIAGKVHDVDAPIAGEILSNMAVERSYEGGPISYVGVGNGQQ